MSCARVVARAIGCSSVLAVVAATPAQARWTTPVPVGQDADATVLAGDVAGRASIVQSSGDGEILSTTHVPGSGWAPPVRLLQSATSEDGALGRDGTLAVRTAPGQMTVGRVDGAGALTGRTVETVPAGTEADAAASAPGGAVLVATTDTEDRLLAYVRGPGQPAVPVRRNSEPAVLGTDVGSVAVVATGAGAFVVSWVEGAESGAPSVRAVAISGTTAGATVPLSGGVEPGSTIEGLGAAATGADAVVGWIVATPLGAKRAQVRSVTRFSSTVPAVTLNPGFAAEHLDLASGPAGVLATWGGTFGQRTEGAASVVSGAGVVSCTVAHDLTRSFVAPTPSGLRVVGAGAASAGRPAGDLAVTGCSVGSRETGPQLGSVPGVTGALDAEGSAVAAFDGSGDEPRRVAVDDVVPPTITDVVVPTQVAAGAPVPVSAAVADAWGLAEVRWLVGSTPGPAAAVATLDPLGPGTHVVRIRATDRAGNVAESPPVTVQATAVPSPPATDPPASAPPAASPPAPPPGLDGAVPAAPPVAVPVPARPAPSATNRGRASVLGATLVRRGAGWRAVIRTRGATRLRIELFREKPLPGRRLRRPSRCGAPLRRHAPGGRSGERRVRASGDRMDVALSSQMVRALRSRGRYALVVRAYGPNGRPSSAVVHRITVC